MKITKGDTGLVSDSDLFSTVDGRVVEGDDPDANMLIARAGLVIPADLAELLGIKQSAKEEKANHGASEDAVPENHHAKRKAKD